MLSHSNHTETLGFSRISACKQHKASLTVAEWWRIGHHYVWYQRACYRGADKALIVTLALQTSAGTPTTWWEAQNYSVSAVLRATFSVPSAWFALQKKLQKAFVHKLTFPLKNTKYCSTRLSPPGNMTPISYCEQVFSSQRSNRTERRKICAPCNYVWKSDLSKTLQLPVALFFLSSYEVF